MISPYIGSHYPNVQKITGESPQKTLGNGRLTAAAHAATPARRSDKRLLEHFQFEMLRISNHTACRFAEKAQFFRSLLAGRRCAAASRFTFFKVETL